MLGDVLQLHGHSVAFDQRYQGRGRIGVVPRALQQRVDVVELLLEGVDKLVGERDLLLNGKLLLLLTNEEQLFFAGVIEAGHLLRVEFEKQFREIGVGWYEFQQSEHLLGL